MRIRTISLLSIVLISLVMVPHMDAAPGGIGTIGDNGCSCHGGPSSDTTVTVTGLPEIYNSSESYLFTVTVTNDVMEIYNDGSTEGNDPWNGRAGGFRILASKGVVAPIDPAMAQEMNGGLTHTAESNGVRTWDFEWTAPADDSQFVEFKIHGNAVNGGDGFNGDMWNTFETTIAGFSAGEMAPSVRALVLLLTAIALALGLILLGVMWVYYSRSPDTFSIYSFWSYLKPWLTTTDHKEVGIMYFLYGFFFFLVGGFLALLFRIQLAVPENTFLTETEYNSFFTLHGTTMIFLAAMPMIAGFMNYVLPLQIGAKDLAFPRINAMGLWLLVFSSPLIYTGIFTGEAADITWVMYPPYSSLTEANLGEGLSQYGANLGTTAFLSGMFMLGASSTLGGVNFITTVFTHACTRCNMDEDAIVHMVSIRQRIHALHVTTSAYYRYCVLAI